MTGDVLAHHDRVVDDEAGGNGERHQGQVVKAEAEEVHRTEAADQRDRHDDPRHGRGARVAEKRVHDEHDEQHRDDQRPLDFPDCGADGRGSVEHDRNIDGAGERCPKLRQRRADAIHGGDDVGAGLSPDDCDHRRLAVHNPGAAQVLDRVLHASDVLQADRGTVRVRNDDRRILLRGDQLIVGEDLPGALRRLETALGALDVRRGDGVPHVLEANAIPREPGRIELDAHCRQRAAAHGHLSDAGDLGELLLKDGRCRVVHMPRINRVRREREKQDRRVGRVELAVGRFAR
jgi:hypothetical protein